MCGSHFGLMLGIQQQWHISKQLYVCVWGGAAWPNGYQLAAPHAQGGVLK